MNFLLKTLSNYIETQKERNMKLHPSQQKLLDTLLIVTEIFDSHDNCFQMSQRAIAKKLELNNTTVDRLFQNMKKKGIAKEVLDVQGVKRIMINPEFYWNHEDIEIIFTQAMFELGSHEAAVEHREMEKDIGYYIDPQTGEMLKPFQYRAHRVYNDTYKHDRTRHRNNILTRQKAIDTLVTDEMLQDILEGGM